VYKTIRRAGRAAALLPTLLVLLSACSDSEPPAVGPITDVLGGHSMSGEPIPCLVAADGVRVCQGDVSNGVDGADLRFRTFDGVPLAVWVTLPSAPASGGDGGYPLVVQSHGWGAPPTGPDGSGHRTAMPCCSSRHAAGATLAAPLIRGR
jgi:hypothetical protein